MKQGTYLEFKTAGLDRIKKRQCVIVTGDGEFAFVAIVLPQQEMRTRIVALASQIEAGRDHEKW